MLGSHLLYSFFYGMEFVAIVIIVMILFPGNVKKLIQSFHKSDRDDVHKEIDKDD